MSESLPPTPPPYPGPPGPADPSPSGPGGFFAALFDFSFTRFVTPMIVKVVYVIGTVAIGLLYLVFVMAGFSDNAGLGIAILLLGPIGALLYLAFFRMMLEMYFAIVRLSEDVHHGRGRL